MENTALRLFERFGPAASSSLIGVSQKTVYEWYRHLADTSAGRHYHTYSHVMYIIHTYMSKCLHYSSDPSPEIIAAAWLHDYVYDPRRDDNEELSALFARKALKGSCVDVALVEKIILNTKGHIGGDSLLDEFNDLDLHILSVGRESSNRFNHYQWMYAKKIRLEYDFVPDEEYRAGRIGFLEKMDNRQIFKTTFFQVCEEAAHLNIRDEIEYLKQI